MADFFGKSRQVNGTFARSAQAEALKKRFLSSNARRKIDNFNVEPQRPRTSALIFVLPADFFEQLNLNLLDFKEPIVLLP